LVSQSYLLLHNLLTTNAQGLRVEKTHKGKNNENIKQMEMQMVMKNDAKHYNFLIK
jgi:hypothetical protein